MRLQMKTNLTIFLVSSVLESRKIKTTQVYAKIIDKQKREAVDTIKPEL